MAGFAYHFPSLQLKEDLDDLLVTSKDMVERMESLPDSRATVARHLVSSVHA